MKFESQRAKETFRPVTLKVIVETEGELKAIATNDATPHLVNGLAAQARAYLEVPPEKTMGCRDI